MQDRPFWGVIIPVFNCEAYIEQAIMSICKQPCKDLLIVVVDDGSTDSSLRICYSLAECDSRIIILHQKNRGVSEARNRGIQYCIETQVSYVAFLDADDVWCKSFYTQDLKESMQNSWADLYEFGYFDGDKTLQKGRHHSLTERTRFCLHFCAFAYKMDIIKRYSIEFPVGKNVHEDCIFFYCFSGCIQKRLSINRDIFIYRSNPVSVLHKEFDVTDRYFNHVIPSWEWAKCKMKDISLVIRKSFLKESSYCETMKRTYLSEYIMIACEHGISVSEIQKEIHAHNMDEYMSLNNSIWIDENSRDRFLSFQTHPHLFWFKCRMRGMIITLGKKVKRIPLFQNMYYPISLNGKIDI